MASPPNRVNIDGGNWINGLQLFNVLQTSAQTNIIRNQNKNLIEAHYNVQQVLSDINDIQHELSTLSRRQLNVQAETLAESKKQTKLIELKKHEEDIEKQLKHTVFEFRKQCQYISNAQYAMERFILYKACLNSMDSMEKPFKYLSEINDKEYLYETYNLAKTGLKDAKNELTKEDAIELNALNRLIQKTKLQSVPPSKKIKNDYKRVTAKKNATIWRSILLIIFSFIAIGVFGSDPESSNLTALDIIFVLLLLLGVLLLIYSVLREIFTGSKLKSNETKKPNREIKKQPSSENTNDAISHINRWLSNYPTLRDQFNAESLIAHIK